MPVSCRRGRVSVALIGVAANYHVQCFFCLLDVVMDGPPPDPPVAESSRPTRCNSHTASTARPVRSSSSSSLALKSATRGQGLCCERLLRWESESEPVQGSGSPPYCSNTAALHIRDTMRITSATGLVSQTFFLSFRSRSGRIVVPASAVFV